MSQRRSNRKRRRRGRFGFLYKLLSVILILAAIFAGCVVFFRVSGVTVTGNARYTAEEIISAAGVEEGDNLFLLNKYQIARSILTKLPYVNEVNIRRGLPDILQINVTECAPVASLQSGMDWWVLDTKGKLLEQGDEALGAEYAVVTGLTPILPSVGSKLAVGEENSAKLQSLTELLSALFERSMAGKVSAIDLSSVASLTLRYDGRFTVELPMTADFSRKVWQLEEVVAMLQSNESGYLDLTGDKGYFRPD
jgi:cell division protein FtsQ